MSIAKRWAMGAISQCLSAHSIEHILCFPLLLSIALHSSSVGALPDITDVDRGRYCAPGRALRTRHENVVLHSVRVARISLLQVMCCVVHFLSGVGS